LTERVHSPEADVGHASGRDRQPDGEPRGGLDRPVAQFVNSFIDRPGNVGVRAGHILRAWSEEGGRAICVCRGAERPIPNVAFAGMGWLGHVPRVMNGARIYLGLGLDHRPLDIALFDWFGRRSLSRLDPPPGPGVAHVWDYCSPLMEALRRRGIAILLDVPIAPATYGLRMRRLGRATFFSDDTRIRDIELAAFDRADLLIAPSRFVADELEQAGVPRDKVAVVEFGVEPPSAARRRPEKRPEGALNYCFLGNVSHRKGVPELLRAWSHPDFAPDRLHLCGRVFPEVKEDIRKAGGGEVRGPGFVRPFDYLPDCDVFVLPSWLEGSAKAVFEAMACGLPVVVTSSAGSVVRDGVEGFVIEPGDVEALRDRMRWFKDNRDAVVSMGTKARERAMTFTWRRYADQVIRHYRANGA
jgi:glycosyltransferase involved in cell wall biosynthesis